MNSGNSGSVQSSSGGDDEYDSRDELISGFMDPSGQVYPISNLHPPFTKQHHDSPSLFDSPSVHISPFRQSTPPASSNPVHSTDLGVTSQSNCTAMVGQASPFLSSQQIFLGARGSNPFHFPTPPPSSSSSGLEHGEQASPSLHQTKTVRHSKKRSRATRGTPTTVLTTDTANFRAMVQEFTGIPPPPFSGRSFAPSRLDLFNTASTARSTNWEQLPSRYPLRPFPQKVQIPSIETASLSNLAMVDSIAVASSANTYTVSSNTTIAPGGNNSYSSTCVNYQLPSHASLLQQANVSSQSLLQSPHPRFEANISSLVARSRESLSIPLSDAIFTLRETEGLRASYLNANANTYSSGLTSPALSDRALATRNDNSLSSSQRD